MKRVLALCIAVLVVISIIPAYADDAAVESPSIDMIELENEVIRAASDNDRYVLEDPVDLYRKYAASNERTSLTDLFNMEDPDFMKTFASIALREAGVEESRLLYEDFEMQRTPENIEKKVNEIVTQIMNQPVEQISSMPDIAEIVLAYEPPSAFKYSEWYYQDEIAILGPEFYYPDIMPYDLIFVTWCAEQLGYISHGYFPVAGTTDGLLYDLELRGNKIFRQNDPFVTPQKDDLMFEPDAFGGYKVSIVTNASEEQISFVGCDISGFAEYHICDVSDIPRDTKFVRMTQIANRHLLSAANFIEKTLNVKPSVAAAILANMYYESRFSPMALGDAGTSFGLCQWHNERWDALVQFCLENGYDWKSTNGQMHFLIYELNTQDKYVGLVQDMMNCDNSAVGAYQCAYYFCTKYEKPEDAENKGDARGVYAYNTVFPMLFSQEMMEEMIEEEHRRLLIDAELQAEVARIDAQAAVTEGVEEPGADLDVEQEETTASDTSAEAEENAKAESAKALTEETASAVQEFFSSNSENTTSSSDTTSAAENTQAETDATVEAVSSTNEQNVEQND